MAEKQEKQIKPEVARTEISDEQNKMLQTFQQCQDIFHCRKEGLGTEVCGEIL